MVGRMTGSLPRDLRPRPLQRANTCSAESPSTTTDMSTSQLAASQSPIGGAGCCGLPMRACTTTRLDSAACATATAFRDHRCARPSLSAAVFVSWPPSPRLPDWTHASQLVGSARGHRARRAVVTTASRTASSSASLRPGTRFFPRRSHRDQIQRDSRVRSFILAARTLVYLGGRDHVPRADFRPRTHPATLSLDLERGSRHHREVLPCSLARPAPGLDLRSQPSWPRSSLFMLPTLTT